MTPKNSEPIRAILNICLHKTGYRYQNYLKQIVMPRVLLYFITLQTLYIQQKSRSNGNEQLPKMSGTLRYNTILFAMCDKLELNNAIAKKIKLLLAINFNK